MSELAREMRANKTLEGTFCQWCKQEVKLGDKVAVCTACDTVHHIEHWEEHDGCANKSCVNAPFTQISDPTAAKTRKPQLRAGEIECPHCGAHIWAGSHICSRCHRPTSPDGVYRGPTSLHSGARNALIMAIVGIFILGLILGIIAFRNGSKAIEEIRSDYTLHGEGVAQAARVLGALDVIFWAMALCARL